MKTTFDSIIVGGGPAGLSAAIYLARFRRSVLVLDQASGRWDTAEVNQNYFGFPHGIHTRQLRDLGLQQAQKFGALYQEASVSAVKCETLADGVLFTVTTSVETYTSRTLIIATGVHDHYHGLSGHETFLGTSLFWCITCDGYNTIGKNIVLVGNNDDVACTTLQFLNYTDRLTLVTNSATLDISPQWQAHLKQFNVRVVVQKVVSLEGENRQVQSVVLQDGQKIPAEMVFNEQGAEPNSELAVRLGVTVDEKNYILTNDEQRTNIPYLYAAGDVTRLYSHQIVTAAHEGSMAAQAANYDLYLPHQRL